MKCVRRQWKERWFQAPATHGLIGSFGMTCLEQRICWRQASTRWSSGEVRWHIGISRNCCDRSHPHRAYSVHVGHSSHCWCSSLSDSLWVPVKSIKHHGAKAGGTINFQACCKQGYTWVSAFSSRHCHLGHYRQCSGISCQHEPARCWERGMLLWFQCKCEGVHTFAIICLVSHHNAFSDLHTGWVCWTCWAGQHGSTSRFKSATRRQRRWDIWHVSIWPG